MAESIDGNTGSTEILFHNQTSDNNIVICIFARSYPIPITKETIRMAWKILMVPSKGNVRFSYPRNNKISAFYFDGNNRVTAGPYDAEPGSTWIATAAESGALHLERDVDALPVPDDGYVVHNLKPTDNWSGRVLHFALYKGENTRRPLVSKQCRVGNYVTLTATNTLYFGALIPSFSTAYQFMNAGKKIEVLSLKAVEFSEHDELTLIPDAEFSPLTPVDLLELNDSAVASLEVKLYEEPYNGELMFKAEWKII